MVWKSRSAGGFSSILGELPCSAIQLPAAISFWKSSGFLSFMVCGSRRQYFVFAPHQAFAFPHLYPFPVLTGVVIWPGTQQDYKIKKTPFQVSLLWCIEYGSLSASRNFLMEILRIPFLCGWDVKLSTGWSEKIEPQGDFPPAVLPSQAVPGKYFRPHLVNRRRFQPACCFTAGKSDAGRNLLQPVTGFTSVQRMQTKLTPIFSKGCF